jgi:SAM-dependent methyltransferase
MGDREHEQGPSESEPNPTQALIDEEGGGEQSADVSWEEDRWGEASTEAAPHEGRGHQARLSFRRVRDELEQRLEASGYSRAGFAERYDAVRPRPPIVLGELLPPLAGVERPRLVVDLGSGTGLSTRFWAESAVEVIGVEPQRTMREWAESVTQATNVRYLDVSSDDTGLAEGCADIVTAAQSLQWMEPGPTFAEIGRILRAGGVFCAYEYVHLQTPLWEPETAWADVIAAKRRLRAERGLDHRLWPVTRERLEKSGRFSFVRELGLHSVEEGDGERLLALALSEGSLTTLLEAGATEEEVGLDRLREVARAMPRVAWLISYRACIGRK